MSQSYIGVNFTIKYDVDKWETWFKTMDEFDDGEIYGVAICVNKEENTITFMSDDLYDLDMFCETLKSFLEDNEINEKLTFEFAVFSSSEKGDFYGGVAIISKNNVEQIYTSDIVELHVTKNENLTIQPW